MICNICKKDKKLTEFDKDPLNLIEGITSYCTECMEDYLKAYPPEIKKLKETYRNMLKRCNLISHPDYKWYGKKDIKVKISFEELKKLYFEQGGDKLKQPSIHRRKSNLSYEKSNIVFMEWELHRKFHRIRNGGIK